MFRDREPRNRVFAKHILLLSYFKESGDRFWSFLRFARIVIFYALKHKSKCDFSGLHENRTPKSLKYFIFGTLKNPSVDCRFFTILKKVATRPQESDLCKNSIYTPFWGIFRHRIWNILNIGDENTSNGVYIYILFFLHKITFLRSSRDFFQNGEGTTVYRRVFEGPETIKS